MGARQRKLLLVLPVVLPFVGNEEQMSWALVLVHEVTEGLLLLEDPGPGPHLFP